MTCRRCGKDVPANEAVCFEGQHENCWVRHVAQLAWTVPEGDKKHPTGPSEPTPTES